MYAAQSGDGQGDFASVAIKDQHLEFRFDTGSGKENENIYRVVLLVSRKILLCFPWEL